MSSYTDVFGGSSVQPSEVSYSSFTMTTNQILEWPFVNPETAAPFARVFDITPTMANLVLTLPDATFVSPGMDTVIGNRGAVNLIIQDAMGGVVATVLAGQFEYVYLRSNATKAGSWGSFTFGTGTSSASAASLAGLGIKAIGSLLNQRVVVTETSANYTLNVNDRASLVAWTGGSGTFSFVASGTLGSDWFVLIRNAGTGTLTLDPNGAELIDGVTSLILNPGESLIAINDGVQFFTVGRGRDLTASFSRLVKNVAGGSDVTLTSTEAAFDVIDFVGVLTANINVIVPSIVARWYMYNNTTGAFTLTVKTAAGTGVALVQGVRNIFECDGTNVVKAVDSGLGTVTSITAGGGLTGGTITTSGTIAHANSALAPGAHQFQTSFTTDIYGHVTASDAASPMPLTSGGTGATTASGARTNLGLGTAATQNTGTSGANVPLLNAANTWSATQTFATVQAVNYVAGTGLTTDAGTFGFINTSGPGISFYGTAATGAQNIIAFTASDSTQMARFNGAKNLIIGSGTTAATGYANAGDVTLGASNSIYGLNQCKAWVNLNGSGGATVRSSFNVASVTRNSAGSYTVTLTNALANTNGAVIATCLDSTSFGDRQASGYVITTTTIKVLSGQTATTNAFDATYVQAAVFSQ